MNKEPSQSNFGLAKPVNLNQQVPLNKIKVELSGFRHNRKPSANPTGRVLTSNQVKVRA